MMRWILLLIAALVLLPFVWHLLALITGVAFGLLHVALLVVVASLGVAGDPEKTIHCGECGPGGRA